MKYRIMRRSFLHSGHMENGGLRANIPFFPLPYPPPSTLLLTPRFPHFSHVLNVKNSFSQPIFRSACKGMLAMQTSTIGNGPGSYEI